MKISTITLFILLLFITIGYSQKTLSGKVMNSASQPIAKAKIFLDSINSKVETNKKGEFKVELPEKVNTINIYSNEYGLLSSKFNDETVMNFMYLESEANQKQQSKKNEDVILGYSKVSQKYEANLKQSVEAEKVVNNYRSIYELLRGRLPGVTITRDNKITIRGTSSIRNISDPLFVVNGMIVSSIDYILPSEVKSVSVLKDGAASIYGAQASNGVILINTK